MSYLLIAVIAYLLNGVSLVIDKFLVNHSLKSPFVYTFYIGVLSFLSILLIPLSSNPASLLASFFAVLSGIIFAIALLLFFTALKSLSLTVVSPIVGTANPVSALILGMLFLSQALTNNQTIGFLLLIIGSLILTFNLWWGKHKLDRRFALMLGSGFCFGLSYVLLKAAFDMDSFINGLIISRLAMAFFVLIFLVFPPIRSEIFSSKLTKNNFFNKTSSLVLGSQLAGGISGLLIAYAVSLSSPALVNSIYGIQYLVLLSAAYLLAKNNPNILEEKISKKNISQKIIATLILGIGLFYLAK